MPASGKRSSLSVEYQVLTLPSSLDSGLTYKVATEIKAGQNPDKAALSTNNETSISHDERSDNEHHCHALGAEKHVLQTTVERSTTPAFVRQDFTSPKDDDRPDQRLMGSSDTIEPPLLVSEDSLVPAASVVADDDPSDQMTVDSSGLSSVTAQQPEFLLDSYPGFCSLGRQLSGVQAGTEADDDELVSSDPNISSPPDFEHEVDTMQVVRQQDASFFDDCTTMERSSFSPASLEVDREDFAMMFSIPEFILRKEPTFSLASPEMLSSSFDRYTCGILSVKDGPGENPWRTVIWPMTTNCAALYHAMFAVSAFHASHNTPALRIAGTEHNRLSVRNLAEGINDGSMGLDTAIATTLALAFAESWDVHTKSGIDHIKGARTLIDIALQGHRGQSLEYLGRLKFLCNAWVYMDVIARLTSTDVNEQHDDYERVFDAFNDTNAVHNGFDFCLEPPIDAQLDPLMGCASTLFPLIGRTASLARRVRQVESNSPAIISQAMELELALETWDPPDYIESPEDATSTIQHSIQTAEAYRWATLLYLHQAVPEIPCLTSDAMAKRVMVLLATVPLASRFITVQIFPLMAAGCEASSDEDRQWVRDRWTGMGRRLRIGVIDRCVEVTEEVWRRRDAHEARAMSRSSLASPLGLRRPTMSSIGVDPECLLGRQSSFDIAVGTREYSNSFAAGRRNTMSGPSDNLLKPSRRGVRDLWNGSVGPQYTVRGELHWLGVMRDWEWQVLLG